MGETGRVRGLVRQEVTEKVMCNFYLYGEELCKLGKMPQNENAWTWSCYDQSDDEPSATMFACRFVKKEHVAKFKEVFEESYNANMKLKWGKKEEAKEEKKEE